MKKFLEDILKELKAKFTELLDDDDTMDDSEDDIFESDDIDDLLDNIIVFNDENGDEVEFEFLDLVEYKDEEYVILLPKEDNSYEEDGADEVVILKIENTGNSDEESYTSVEDEGTLQAVFEIFREKFKDDFNFVDA